MTREEKEEAIIILKDMVEYGWGFSDQYKSKSIDALNIAIEVLEQESVLDKIRAEFISLYPKNYAGEPEFGGLFCRFSLNKVLSIIDKYKTESED